MMYWVGLSYIFNLVIFNNFYIVVRFVKRSCVGMENVDFVFWSCKVVRLYIIFVFNVCFNLIVDKSYVFGNGIYLNILWYVGKKGNLVFWNYNKFFIIIFWCLVDKFCIYWNMFVVVYDCYIYIYILLFWFSFNIFIKVFKIRNILKGILNIGYFL